MGENQTTRIRGVSATLAVLVGLIALALAAPASAFHSKNPSAPPGTDINGDYRGFDPMETSVPYLAWRGEEVRLVKCRSLRETESNLAETSGEWDVIDWSGDPHVWPKFFDDVDRKTSSFGGKGDQEGRECWAIDITSHKPGIAVVKLKVDAPTADVPGEGTPDLVHQFNVIWMSLDQAILRNLSGGQGGPSGPITENPGQSNRLGVVVKGRVPLNEQFRTELGAQRPALNAGAIVLPDAWPELAQTSLAHISRDLELANDGNRNNDPVNPDGPERFHSAFPATDFWDIHDSTGPYNTTVYGVIAGAGGNPAAGVGGALDWNAANCGVPPTGIPVGHSAACHVPQVSAGMGGDADCDNTSTTPPANDTVDNCDPGEFGVFSRVFHDVSGPPTLGPYSPTRPDETMLSDSLVNLHDAPMPAAVVFADIAPNTGGTDIGGVGFFSAVDKAAVYNRGGTECPTASQAPHCLTAPFYGAYAPPSPTMEANPAELLPAGPEGDDDADTASGIHGAIANNFQGYLPVRLGANLGFYNYWDIADVARVAVAEDTACVDPPRQGFRPTPSGPQRVALYTDEHGEAQFQFNAGLGFFFDNFIVDPTQGGCRPEGLIGTADITVDARYPFQPVTHAGVTSNRIQKRIESLFRKGIICVPKPGEEDDKVLCVAFGRDIDGTPLIGERVCVTALGDAFVRDFDEDSDSTREGDSTVCATLDENPDGKEDLGTDLFPTIDKTFATETFLIIGRGSVRLIADFRDERLEFPTTVTIPPDVVTPPAPPPVTPPPVAPPPTPPPTPQVVPPPPITPQIVQTTPIVQTTEQTTTTRPTTTRRPTVVKKKAKPKKKVKAKKKVKKVKRQSVCILRGRVVRPCVRGNG